MSAAVTRTRQASAGPRPPALRPERLPWALGLIVALAAVLRFSGIGGVGSDAFYDAAVRSMSSSFHNFLFGAFDPTGVLSIDKPPLDLWLQVASVKVFGWGGFALKLPEALAGTLAVAVLYDLVRRVLGKPAGLAAAAALAVLPESVLTSRSDTMDSVMMLLVLGALWLVVQATQAAGVPQTQAAGEPQTQPAGEPQTQPVDKRRKPARVGRLLRRTRPQPAFDAKGLSDEQVLHEKREEAARQREGAARQREGAARQREGAATQGGGATRQRAGAAWQRAGAARQPEGAAPQRAGTAPQRAGTRRPGRRALIVLAGVALGLAFNVKLLQALLPLPAFVLLYWLAASGSRLRRAADLAWAGAALVAVGLSWAVAVSLAPGHHPWAVGSSDGSVWNAMFVFNGIGKVGGAPVSHRPGGPGPLRLLVSTGWHYDLLFGCVLLAALLVAVMAAWVTLRGERHTRPARVFILALAVWVGLGILVFDTMTTVHARYLEALSPALAALIGWGATALAGLSRRAARPALGPIAFALALTALYTVSLDPGSGRGAAALVLATVGAGLLARSGGRIGHAARWATAVLIVASVLVFPVHESLSLIRAGANDSLGTATARPGEIAALSRYLAVHSARTRFELAVDEPLSLAPLIVRDDRGILPLTSWGGRPLSTVADLRAALKAGQVRYGLVGAYRCTQANRTAAACAPAARWIRRHGQDVTAAAGLTGRSRLYLLPGARS